MGPAKRSCGLAARDHHHPSHRSRHNGQNLDEQQRHHYPHPSPRPALLPLLLSTTLLPPSTAVALPVVISPPPPPAPPPPPRLLPMHPAARPPSIHSHRQPRRLNPRAPAHLQWPALLRRVSALQVASRPPSPSSIPPRHRPSLTRHPLLLYNSTPRPRPLPRKRCRPLLRRLRRQCQPSTLNPRPSALNPQHSALNTQHSTLNTQHSTLNTQHSSLNTQRCKPQTKKCWCRFRWGCL